MTEALKANRRSLAAHRQLARSYRTGIWVNGGIVVCAVAATVAAFHFEWYFIAKFTGICGIASGIIGMLKYVAELQHRQRIIGEIEAELAGSEDKPHMLSGFLAPWVATDGDGNALSAELAREVPKGHPLSGVATRAVGRTQDCDDCLFELLDGTRKVAVVHLTWRPEHDPVWPFTRIYDDIEHWRRECMVPDHEEWSALMKTGEATHPP